jgi:sodium/bile acid cotransporter 7
LRTLLLNNFLMIGIMIGACVGIAWPAPGSALNALGLVPVLIVLIFVCSGLMLHTGSLRQEVRNLRAVGFALAAMNGIFPLVALGLARLFNITGDSLIGLLVIASAPPTLASGIIITTLAGGSTALAVLLTVLGNMAAVLIMPVGLQITLSLTTAIQLPVAAMLAKLLYLIVLPTAVGQVARRAGADWVEKRRTYVGFVPNVAMVLIVFMLVSEGSGRIRAEGGAIGWVAGVAVALHVTMLAINRLGAALLGLNLPAAKALTIVGSQKTLPVSALVVNQAFADQPAAIVPCIVFHLLQIILDSLLAQRWSRRTA